MARILWIYCKHQSSTNEDSYTTRFSSFVSTSLQEGQTKTSNFGSTPNFGIVRTRFMVSPQERHTRVGVLSIVAGERSTTGVEDVNSECGMLMLPVRQAGALPDSQPPTPGTRPLPMIVSI